MKKPDMSKVKEFFFQHGERVALGTCAAIALLLVVSGLWNAIGSGKENGVAWPDALNNGARTMQAKLSSGLGEEALKVAPLSVPPWDHFKSVYQQSPLLNLQDTPDYKRRNPPILGLIKDENSFQLDYLDRGYVGYEVNYSGKKVLAIVPIGGKAGAGLGAGAGLAPPGAFGGGAAAGGSNYANVLKPRRTIVVSGIFPMKKMVDDFQTALRLEKLEELFALKELPRVAGINVVRVEHVPGGQPKTVPLILFDPKKETTKPDVQTTLDYAMREGIYEEANPLSLASVIHPGLVTPLPILPEAKKYPKLKIKSDNWPTFAEDDAEKANVAGGAPVLPDGGKQGIAMPKGFQPAGAPAEGNVAQAPTGKEEWILFQKVAKEGRKDLVDKFTGTYNIFHPLGLFPGQAGAVAADNRQPGMAAPPAVGMGANAGAAGAVFGFDAFDGGAAGAPGAAAPGVGAPPGVGAGIPPPGVLAPPMAGRGRDGGAAPAEGGAVPPLQARQIYDALVRFVDVDVEPGKTYSYWIQVRMHNPNFGKRTEVAEVALAEVKELASPWVESPKITTPGDYFLYGVDQFWVDKMGSGEKTTVPGTKADQAVVQVHRWVARNSEGLLIGDWAIAERLLVRKGEPIGELGTLIEMPTWSKVRGGFELLNAIPRGKQTFAKSSGIAINLLPDVANPDGKGTVAAAPVLVDFEGGYRKSYPVQGPAAAPGAARPVAMTLIDDAAVDVLILNPNGKLIARNSRVDSDQDASDPSRDETAQLAAERQARVEAWRERVKSTRGGGAAPAGGPAMPGGAPPAGP